jgi:hypothetical protein
LAAADGLRAVRVDALGTLLVACDQHRYAVVRRLATAAPESLGVGWVNVVTDDSQYAQRVVVEAVTATPPPGDPAGAPPEPHRPHR